VKGEVMVPYNTEPVTVYDIGKYNDKLWSFMASSESVKGPSK
jgi:hypothetical protein